MRPTARRSLASMWLATIVTAGASLAFPSTGSEPVAEGRSFAVADHARDVVPQAKRLRLPWPSAANTGVPREVKLRPYQGPCTVTRDNTEIIGKLVNCNLTIQASGVRILNSKINGTVWNDPDTPGHSFTIRRSNVDAGEQVWSGVGSRNFTARRIEVVGGTRSMMCWFACKIVNSYVHGQLKDEAGREHESGIRMGSQATLLHNTITCDAPPVPPDAGCSAGLTGYGDFAVVEDNLIQDNLFLWSTGGTCAYGGSTRGKPYSEGVNNVRFVDNVFERGPTGNCGIWAATMDFDSDAPGNLWAGNRWRHSKKKVRPWEV